MNDIEKRARELLAGIAREFGQPEYAYHIGCGGRLDRRDKKLIGPIIAALTPPEGYVLVPVVPTEAMVEAFTGFRPVHRTSFACRYEEMLAARPEVP
ncbi:hypothetical protein [Stenotrophomonas sp.]|uniref:hypothetical protein n=1 Tax=Stenotrophomonas sp. TaxID=69392 RepID=UPI0028988FF5|nr:hypothetical protein [Stenotrophomonas sp.]